MSHAGNLRVVASLSLIGVRGCGKSNVSRRLAAVSKRALLSTDVLIQYDNGGQSIAEIARAGWHTFRDLEFQVVAKSVGVTDAIIDCGGGVVVDVDQDGSEIFSQRKVSILREAGPVVWLDGDLERLAEKAAVPTANRPPLSDVQSTIDLMRARLPFYERASDIRIDIEGKSRKQIAREVCLAVEELSPFIDEFAPDAPATA